jgi:uncharacterized membrane protein YeaQ/YmgE (transglycosylase-associated protein family)
VILGVLLLVLIGFLALGLLGAALWALLSTIVVGLIIGLLGRLVVPGRQPIGLLATVLIGFLGAIGGSLIGHAIGTGHLLTVLLEVAVAGLLVAGYSGSRRGRLHTARRRAIGRY